MATYLSVNLQGCYDELQLLLERVDFNPAQDKLILWGILWRVEINHLNVFVL